MSDVMNQDELILKKLQDLKETQLTKKILIPLFKSFGYEKVEFYHGPTEEGKDLVCWRTDDIGDIELAVVQVKRFKFSRKASDNKGFLEIVRQLSVATEKPLPYLDGTSRVPELIYFITPYEIETATLQTRFERYQELRSRRVKIIDGPRLVKLINQNIPDITSLFIDTRGRINLAFNLLFNNEPLLKALESDVRKNIETIYIDIDLSLGHMKTRLFFQSSFNGKVIAEEINADQWSDLCNKDDLAKKELGFNLIISPRDEAEKTYQNRVALFNEWEINYNNIIVDIENAFNELKAITNSYNLNDVFKIVYQKLNPDIISEQKRSSIEAFRSEKAEEADRLVKKFYDSLKNDNNSTTIQSEINYAFDKIKSIYFDLCWCYKDQPRVYYDVELSGVDLALYFTNIRDEIVCQIEKINNNELPRSELRSFLDQCHSIFKITKALLSINVIMKSVGIEESVNYVIEPSQTRLKVPINKILEVGANVAILGEAGAGKTTTLQSYAHSLIKYEKEGKVVIYASLTRIADAWETIENKKIQTVITNITLEEAILEYLYSQNIYIQHSEFIKQLKSYDTVLVLDGIDEIIERIPKILIELERMSEQYRSLQMITSSRISGDYVDNIPFLGISLLPFTDSQRNSFIVKWFGANQKDVATRILKHFKDNIEVAEIVQNPLLATVLCVLAENKVPLPNNEVRLYGERMSLLLGRYDLFKGISRLKTHSSQLYLIAQKIAFKLHKRHLRYENPEVLLVWVNRMLGSRISTKEAQKALEELVEPCNILVRMTKDGQLGFGHLRYQEYLAARELMSKNHVLIAKMVREDWWIGSLVLFAQMSDIIADIAINLFHDGLLEQEKETLRKMIKVIPPEEQRKIPFKI